MDVDISENNLEVRHVKYAYSYVLFEGRDHFHSFLYLTFTPSACQYLAESFLFNTVLREKKGPIWTYT